MESSGDRVGGYISLVLKGFNPGLMDYMLYIILTKLPPIVFCPTSSVRCKNGMNHLRDRVPHMADGLCQYAHQYNNKVIICKVKRAPDTRIISC